MITIFTLGERIMIYRKRLNLSKTALAKKIGISAAEIRRYEYDEEKPSIEVLLKLADVFNMPISDLVCEV